jgi:hypothetical protein
VTTRAELQREANELKRAGAANREKAARLRQEADLCDKWASSDMALARQLEHMIDAGEFEGQG